MLSGNLAEFALLDVLQLLLSSNRAGKLRLASPRGGDVWLGEGAVLHARALGSEGEAALGVLAGVCEGGFDFERGEAPPKQTVALRPEALLPRMLRESDAWQPLSRAFPDWNTPLRFTNAWSAETRVTRRQYQALSLVGRGDLRAMVQASTLPPRELLEVLLPFWQAGKIEYTA